ncbi:MAG: PPC domain-containing protein [Anaerolineae bacterium]|nr:PPC domain-containing protein [Anaerolineae bacterium]
MRSTKLLMLLASLCLLLIVPMTALAQGGTELAYGGSAEGQFTDGVTEVLYTFTGSAGDLIVARMTANTSPLDSYLILRDPSGTQVAYDDDDGGSLNSMVGPFALPVDGTYTLVATRCCPGSAPNTGEGSFVVTLEQTTAQPLTTDQPITFDLVDAQQTLIYTYAVTEPLVAWIHLSDLAGVGQVILNVLNLNGDIVLYDSRMMDVQPPAPQPAPVYFSQPGSYLITVRIQAASFEDPTPPAPSISGTLSAVELPTMPMAIGDTVSGTLDDSQPFDVYTFDATKDQLLSLSGSTEAGSAPFDALLYDPNGIQILYNTTTNDAFQFDPMQITLDGRYVVVARRSDNGQTPVDGTSGSYSFTLDVSGTATLVSGQEVTGEVPLPNNVYEQVYRFDGVQGQRVRITLRSLDNQYSPGLYVNGPAVEPSAPGQPNPGNYNMNINSSVSGTATFEMVLPTSGIYLFRVANSTMSSTSSFPGHYGLMIEVLGE